MPDQLDLFTEEPTITHIDAVGSVDLEAAWHADRLVPDEWSPANEKELSSRIFRDEHDALWAGAMLRVNPQFKPFSPENPKKWGGWGNVFYVRKIGGRGSDKNLWRITTVAPTKRSEKFYDFHWSRYDKSVGGTPYFSIGYHVSNGAGTLRMMPRGTEGHTPETAAGLAGYYTAMEDADWKMMGWGYDYLCAGLTQDYKDHQRLSIRYTDSGDFALCVEHGPRLRRFVSEYHQEIDYITTAGHGMTDCGYDPIFAQLGVDPSGAVTEPEKAEAFFSGVITEIKEVDSLFDAMAAGEFPDAEIEAALQHYDRIEQQWRLSTPDTEKEHLLWDQFRENTYTTRFMGRLVRLELDESNWKPIFEDGDLGEDREYQGIPIHCCNEPHYPAYRVLDLYDDKSGFMAGEWGPDDDEMEAMREKALQEWVETYRQRGEDNDESVAAQK